MKIVLVYLQALLMASSLVHCHDLKQDNEKRNLGDLNFLFQDHTLKGKDGSSVTVNPAKMIAGGAQFLGFGSRPKPAEPPKSAEQLAKEAEERRQEAERKAREQNEEYQRRFNPLYDPNRPPASPPYEYMANYRRPSTTFTTYYGSQPGKTVTVTRTYSSSPSIAVSPAYVAYMQRNPNAGNPIVGLLFCICACLTCGVCARICSGAANHKATEEHVEIVEEETIQG